MLIPIRTLPIDPYLEPPYSEWTLPFVNSMDPIGHSLLLLATREGCRAVPV